MMVQSTNSIDEDRWLKLLEWLVAKHGFNAKALHIERRLREGAGYGLFATSKLQPSSTLFTIPASALINHKTLRATYPVKSTANPLTAFQIISLHLWLHRPVGKSESMDSLFGPYISVLPRDFSSHPLTWQVEHELGLEPETKAFLDALPASVSRLLIHAAILFFKDWRAVFQYA
jgi:hypothetical protein